MLLRHSFVLIVILFTLLNVQTIEGKRGRYRYNHPPSIETADTVPVAAVPESGDVRESKTLKLPTDTKIDPTEDITKAKENNKETQEPTQISKTDVVAPEPQGQKKNIERKPLLSRTNNRRNLQIPVNVVYETEPKKVQSSLQESEEGSKKVVQRRNQIRRRLQKPKALEDSQKEEQKPQEEKNKKEEQRPNDNTSNLIQDKKSAESTIIVPSSTPSPKIETTESVAAKDQTPVTTERSRKMRYMRTRPPIVPIVSEENFVYSHSGNFHYRFEGGDGTKVFEEGTLKSINKDTGEAVQGGFSYTDMEGNDYSISYTADENGYRPSGAHLPTPPPIPPAIARALAYLATKPTPEPVTESIKNVD